MRILLVGEYSGLHNTLKEGLLALGHEVTLVGTGDNFKNYPVDLSIEATFFKNGLPNLLRQLIFRITRKDLAHWEYGYRLKKLLPQLAGFDIIQLISETPIYAPLETEFRLLEKLKQQNAKMFCLCTGTDYTFMKACVEGRYRYSLLDPYLADKSLADEYRYALPYLTRRYKKHHEKIRELVSGYIATDIDYHIAMEGQPKYLGIIPNPVKTRQTSLEQSEQFRPKERKNVKRQTTNDERHIGTRKPSTINHQPSTPIVIFHGINRWNYHKKGNRFFEAALDIIGKKYGERVKIITAENMPHSEYLKAYDSCHILLDQVYAYDQGYNALEAMAGGKVVFTGAEKEFYEYYGLTEKVAVNALPDVGAIVAELSDLIENPESITQIGCRANEFINREHDFAAIARNYLLAWNKFHS